MATLDPGARISLQIVRTLAHPREKVFDAWTDPAKLSLWMAPSDEYVTIVHALDLRPGGAYRLTMKHQNGNESIVFGKYLEVVRPSKLVFTWSWEGMPERGEETLVTVELRERGRETELTLSHERFTSEEMREKHQHGWEGCLGRLPARLT